MNSTEFISSLPSDLNLVDPLCTDDESIDQALLDLKVDVFDIDKALDDQEIAKEREIRANMKRMQTIKKNI